MAQQEGGWPLGLQPLNVRIGLVRSADFSGSISFNTLISGSPTSSTDSSSDFDTESTGSFFHDRSITLGRLIGITSILELSSRSFRSRRQGTIRGKKSQKTRTWFSLCAKGPANSNEAAAAGNAPSLRHFLEVERRASNVCRRNPVPATYELDGLPESQPVPTEPNSLFSNGRVAPPQVGGGGGGSSPVVGAGETETWVGSDDGRRPNRDLGHVNGYGIPLRFPCLGGCTV